VTSVIALVRLLHNAALNRIAAAGEALGIKLVRGEKAAAFVCEGETIGFSVSEGTRREKHVLTDKEREQQEAWQRKQQRRWKRDAWDSGSYFSRPRFPEWDYHPTGKLSFEFEQCYLRGGSPRRSFRDAKVQRLETMASEIAVGMAVLAAAKQADRLRREEEAREREEARCRRELALRAQHVEERRGAALDEILGELAALDRLRRLVADLREVHGSAADGRLKEFVAFAERRLASREAALSAEGLGKRFGEQRLFGEDDAHDFRPPRLY
jgi:hypothetical protein